MKKVNTFKYLKEQFAFHNPKPLQRGNINLNFNFLN